MSQTPKFAARLWRPAFLLLASMSLVPGHAALAQPSSASAAALQQELSLFEAVSGTEQAAGPAAQSSNTQGPGPAFTLVGTSRIGSKYTAILAGRDGNITRVNAAPGSTVAIPDHAGYQLVGIGSREVSLTTPGSDPCIEQQDQGVSCSAIGVTHLTLTTAAPIVVPTPDGDAVPNADEAAVDPNTPPAGMRVVRTSFGNRLVPDSPR